MRTTRRRPFHPGWALLPVIVLALASLAGAAVAAATVYFLIRPYRSYDSRRDAADRRITYSWGSAQKRCCSSARLRAPP